MATRRQNQQSHNHYENASTRAASAKKGNYYDMPVIQARPAPRTSIVESLDLSDATKAFTTYNGGEYQLFPVEIEKEAELGLVVGQIEGEKWVFIDEILSNGMIEMHGILKEGDYLIQAGVYSLVGIDVSRALLIIERAYDEGRKTISFVAARQQKPDSKTKEPKASVNEKKHAHTRDRVESRARSFVEYENEEDPQDPPSYLKAQYENNDTQF